MQDSSKPSPQKGMTLTPGLIIAGLITGIAAFGIALLVMFQNRNAATLTTPTDTVGGEYRGTLLEPPEDVGDFTLTNQEGEAVSLSDWRGNWVLLFFGFTHCPDYCPTTLSEYKRIHEALGADADKVRFAFISVDGERDTPQVLKEYLQVRGVADFVTGLTADEATLAPVLQEFGVQVSKIPSGESYTVEHTTASFLLNPEGQLRVLFSFDDFAFTLNPDMIAGRIKELIAG
jgi:protein SCO1/2